MNNALMFSSKSDEWSTPQDTFDRLNSEFLFDVDLAATAENAKVPSFYTKEMDSLSISWSGDTMRKDGPACGWLNPPYSSPQQWIEKFLAHGDGVALVQVSKARWFDRLWASSVPMVLNRADFKFIATDGTYKGVFMPTCFIALGDECVEALARLGRVR